MWGGKLLLAKQTNCSGAASLDSKTAYHADSGIRCSRQQPMTSLGLSGLSFPTGTAGWGWWLRYKNWPYYTFVKSPLCTVVVSIPCGMGKQSGREWERHLKVSNKQPENFLAKRNQVYYEDSHSTKTLEVLYLTTRKKAHIQLSWIQDRKAITGSYTIPTYILQVY